MKNKIVQNYDIKKVHKVNLLTIYVISTVINIIVFFSRGTSQGIQSIFRSGITCVLMTVLYFISISDNIKALLYSLLPAFTATLMFYTIENYSLGAHYLIFISIAMISLYFNRKILIIYGVILNLLFIGISLTSNEILKGTSGNTWSFISIFIFLNTAICLLIFLTKWGRNLVDDFVEKENESKEFLNKLNTSLAEIENGANVLNSTILNLNNNTNSSKESIGNVNVSMQQMSMVIGEQAASLNIIKEKMNNASKDALENEKISKEISNDASRIKDNVIVGSSKVEEMNSQWV